MSINVGGLIISDIDIKAIMGEKEFIIIFLNKMLEKLQIELAKGYDMKITKLPDGRRIIEPEGKEQEVLDWMTQRMGTTAFEDQINTFIKQRQDQKEYDELVEIGKGLKELDDNEKEEVMTILMDKVQAAKIRKGNNGGLEPTIT